MSKVVEFLRPDIPRILINRNIVQVPKVSHKDDDSLFHACLLGDCGEFDSFFALLIKNGFLSPSMFMIDLIIVPSVRCCS
jgi:hypothetical protein